jgi:PAS domain S-box-containing protein
LGGRLLFESAHAVDEPTHEFLELAGCCVALTAALVVWLHTRHADTSAHLQWIVVGLLGVGLVDGAHGIAPFGIAWSWLRPVATLLGGSLFALVWLPPALMSRKRFFFVLALVVALAGSVAVWLRPALLPTPLSQPGYALATEAAAIVGSGGFLAAALFFFRRCRRSQTRPDVLFAGQTLLFAAAGALLALSPLWAGDWWVWYGFRLTAYSVALFAGYEMVVAIYRDQARLAGKREQVIQEREQVIQERTEELHRLAEIVESSNDDIFSKSLDGTITSWNASAERMYGYSANEAVGQPLTLIVPPELHPEVRDLLNRVARGESVKHHETERVRKDGTRIDVSVTVSPIKARDGRVTGASAIARDITDRRRVERELQDLNSSLERRVTDRTSDLLALNQELESFNYSISHDLRSPLRHVDSYAKILEEYSSEMPADARLCLQRIRDGAQRMSCMVDELLTLSRTSRREVCKQITGLGLLVREVIEEFKPELRTRDIEWCIGELPFADCDPALTRQVFANLLSNALKFSRTRKPAVIEVGHTVVDGQAILYVRDNGVGFSMNYADKLFGVFQRLHRREDFEGTGVGLVTVQRIIHKHGGRIWAQAEIEKGATFYFTLQRSANSPSPKAGTETISAGKV